MAVTYGRFGTTFRFQLQRSSLPRWTVWPLKLGLIGCLETSIRNCRCTLRKTLQERIFNLRSDEEWFFFTWRQCNRCRLVADLELNIVHTNDLKGNCSYIWVNISKASHPPSVEGLANPSHNTWNFSWSIEFLIQHIQTSDSLTSWNWLRSFSERLAGLYNL
jgi:hypothetical protein